MRANFLPQWDDPCIEMGLEGIQGKRKGEKKEARRKDTHISIPGDDRLSTKDDSLHAGSADLVYCRANCRLGKPRTDCALSCGILSQAVKFVHSQSIFFFFLHQHLSLHPPIVTERGDEREGRVRTDFAERTFPKKTSSTPEGSTTGTFARAALMAWDPNWVAVNDASELQLRGGEHKTSAIKLINQTPLISLSHGPGNGTFFSSREGMSLPLEPSKGSSCCGNDINLL